MKGDARYGCTTMPIVWGIPAAKVFMAVWLIVLSVSLAIVQFYGLMKGWWLGALYALTAILLPMLWILRSIYLAATTNPIIIALVWPLNWSCFSGHTFNVVFQIIHVMERIVLASQSPRRKQLLQWAEIDFDIVVPETDEQFPASISLEDAPVFIARNKALAVQQSIQNKQGYSCCRYSGTTP